MSESLCADGSSQHDWRINPWITLSTYPAQSQHVCAICGAKKASGFRYGAATSHDPKDWPRA